MRREEIFKELMLSYQELTKYLIEKYGAAVSDYFCTPDCKSRNKKTSRTKEGLYCHHIDEDKGGNLSESFSAKTQPYEWQKKERLVYCNILEHLILHIKIAVLRQKKRLQKPSDIEHFFTTGGIYMVCHEINDMFSQNGTSVTWKQRCFDEVKENYTDYIILLKTIMCYIQEQYQGEKTKDRFLKIGSKVVFANTEGKIVKIDETRNRIFVKTKDGKEGEFVKDSFMSQFTFGDEVNMVARYLAMGSDGPVGTIYESLLNTEKNSKIFDLCEMLAIDFHGYGFPQLTDFYINESQYGAINADEYISKAYPSFIESSYVINKEQPIFWKGDIPKKIERNKTIFYIVRLEVSFDIKPEKQPFVRYKERDLLRMDSGATDDNNFLHRKGIILRTSDIYDNKTGKYYSKYKDMSGRIVSTSVKLTLTREDFYLFKERYIIKEMKILDGCYF